MARDISNIKQDILKLKKIVKHNGFDRWRCVFTGFHTVTGEKTFFFIELYAAVSKVPAGIKNGNLSDNAVSSSYAVQDLLLSDQPAAVPSQPVVVLKAGIFGNSESIVEMQVPVSDITISKKNININGSVFFLDEQEFRGSVQQIRWNFSVRRQSVFVPGKIGAGMYWAASGVEALFSGEIHVKDDVYLVSPGTSSGYIDRIWGKAYPYPFFHLSCSHLSSLISRTFLKNSCIAVQGMYTGSFAVFFTSPGNTQPCNFSLPRIKKNPHFSCIATDNILHWAVSFEYHKFLLDLDVYSETNGMFVKTYNSLSNPDEQFEILCGAGGTGELRLYKRKGKNIELLEHASLEDVCCEYGGVSPSDNGNQ